jgi:hypothetical protein
MSQIKKRKINKLSGNQSCIYRNYDKKREICAPFFSPQAPNVHNYPNMKVVPILNNVKG